MLSDEEKILVKKLRYCEQEYEQNGYLSVGKFEAIKEAANLIEKQSKEIEELKAHQIIFTNDYKPIGSKGRKFISENKIKAKIQECREILYSFEKELELKANKEKYIHKESMNCLLSQISILQSLLEKE